MKTLFLMRSWGTQYAAFGVERAEAARRVRAMGLGAIRIRQMLRAYDEQMARG